MSMMFWNRKKTQHASRTRFAKDIVCEFMSSARESDKVAILCSGAPTYPGGKGDVMQFFADKGYWVFNPRYRGTWESDGVFLERSPHEDVIDVMNGIQTGFTDFNTGIEYKLPTAKFYLLGGSFGGPAIILASRDPRVVKAVALSPVVDWTQQEGTSEPLDMMAKFVPLAFGQAYRADPVVWHKLAKGDFYNPVREAESVDGKKLLIMHAEDDDVVLLAPARDFAENIGATFVPLKKGGHFGTRNLTERRFWRHVKAFLRS